MSSRSNLVPTPVTDKNGKATTVYRKPQSSAGVKLLPSPAPIPQMSSSEAVKNAYDRLCRSSETIDRLPGNTFNNLNALGRESTVVLGELISHIESAGPDESECWSRMLTRGNYDPSHSYFGGSVDLEGGEFYRRHIAVKGLASGLAYQSKLYAGYTFTENAISYAERLCAGHYGKGYAKLRAGIIAYAVDSLQEKEYEWSTSRHGLKVDKRDIEYMAKNIDAVETMLDQVVARSTTDREVLKEMITAHPSLAEGSL